MTNSGGFAFDDHADDYVDEQISAHIDPTQPVSFFLFAGAGSGKTRSLVNALNFVRNKSGKRLRLYGQRVGVITYTNAACDEIKKRLEYDLLFEVSTIHSFVWALISGLQIDIREWLRTNLTIEIAELEELQIRGRAGTKAALGREEAISTKKQRFMDLDRIERFTYNPSGENIGRDSLSHAEVIKIGASFLTQKPLMQRMLTSKFPILFVNESQDTNKLLMEALLKVQAEHRQRFCLGLFGDTMQRIYADGKVDLGHNLPEDWAKPSKKLNHRCPRRIVALVNKIRSQVDGQEQVARSDSEDGFARLFIFPSDIGDKTNAEQRVTKKMAGVTGDPLWAGDDLDVKTLILEHHMAARRMGFLELFASLSQVESLQTGLRDGSLPGLRLFSQLVLPLLKAKECGDEFTVASIVRGSSPLLSKLNLKESGKDQRRMLQTAREAITELTALCSNHNPRFLDVLSCLSKTRLFEIPESLRPIAARERRVLEEVKAGGPPPVEDDPQSYAVLEAWDKCLLTPFYRSNRTTGMLAVEQRSRRIKGLRGANFHVSW